MAYARRPTKRTATNMSRARSLLTGGGSSRRTGDMLHPSRVPSRVARMKGMPGTGRRRAY